MDAAAPKIPPLAAGDPPVIGRCALLGRLGAGGMGVVYLGRAPDGRRVAVKTLHPAMAGDPEARRRFHGEAAYAQRVASFCTARVLEDGSHRDRPYIVTEYIEGPPLSRVVERRGPLPPGAVTAVGIGVAVALVAIHGAGLVHRDLKPANVLLAPSGPRVIDFGIACEPEPAEALTEAGMVMGSPGWIAPERLTGGAATAAADVFGWGCLVAYAATGRHPFGTGPMEGLAERIMHLRPDLDGLEEPLRPLVTAALAKDPADRPAAVELLHGLLSLRADGDAVAAIARLWQPADFAGPPPPRHRPRLRTGIAAAWTTAAAVVAVGAAMSIEPGTGVRHEPGRVEVVVSTPPVTGAEPVTTVRRVGGDGTATPSPGVTGSASARPPQPTPRTDPPATRHPATPGPAPSRPLPVPVPTPSVTPPVPTKIRPPRFCKRHPRKCDRLLQPPPDAG
ncbi:serine/threonine-protein kinase [Actinomadura macrotermitis]|uniref:Serine/threonine-protein kinase PknD n=1 Tax=Actinomadura macrotermitis TaxID=2585200 RepID=A0A7K0BRT7_9ACTN|nr:serine/threonine-protein kinase [Actinomadura macrotermitis]MQY03913.1 Serine/threonine-protein kinase PknD [Actinomadura macrotermitis]